MRREKKNEKNKSVEKHHWNWSKEENKEFHFRISKWGNLLDFDPSRDGKSHHVYVCIHIYHGKIKPKLLEWCVVFFMEFSCIIIRIVCEMRDVFLYKYKFKAHRHIRYRLNWYCELTMKRWISLASNGKMRRIANKLCYHFPSIWSWLFCVYSIVDIAQFMLLACCSTFIR